MTSKIFLALLLALIPSTQLSTAQAQAQSSSSCSSAPARSTVTRQTPRPASSAKDALRLGKKYYYAQDYAIAFLYLQQAGADNALDPEGLYLLSEMFYYGRGVHQNSPLSLYYTKRAAAQHDVHALNDLGDYYYRGKLGLQKNFLKSLAYYLKAAKLGSTWAQITVLDHLASCDFYLYFDFWSHLSSNGMFTKQPKAKALCFFEPKKRLSQKACSVCSKKFDAHDIVIYFNPTADMWVFCNENCFNKKAAELDWKKLFPKQTFDQATIE